jgi:hypothetical protein
MKRALINFIRLFIPDRAYREWKRKYLIKKSEIAPIIKHPDEIYDKVYHIKDATWEKMQIPAIYKMTRLCDLECYHGEQDILRIPNAKVYNVSDVVLTSEGIVWDKAYRQDFSKIIPLDKNYLKHDMDNVYLLKYKQSVHVHGICLSLLGVHADIWAHFLVQFLPKLFYAEEAGLFEKPISVLMPKYKDANITEMVNMAIGKYDTVNIIEVVDNVEYCCDTLMYIPTASYIGNHLYYTSPFDTVIPHDVFLRIQSKIVDPLIEKVKNNPVRYEKLYLPRKNAGYRGTTNIQEVDEYFRAKGFHFVEGSQMTMEEKADMFMHAKFIAGPYSSAWINTIFCRGAKGLILTNVPKSIETYYLTLAGEDNIEFFHVQGYDLGNDHQCNFYMPMERVENAYKQFLGK